MITTFLPSINHVLSPEVIKTLRTYTRELRNYIQSTLTRFPATFYHKKADGEKKKRKKKVFYHSCFFFV